MRLLLAVGVLLAVVAPAAAQWEPPVGIPEPPAALRPDRSTPADPGGWPGAEVTGSYYIDNTHGSCTDTANTYGYPNLPRCTLPNANISFIEGAKMVLVGGGVDYVITANRNWTSAGTEANPVVIDGTLDPVINSTNDLIQLGGTWFIVQDITLEETRMIDNSAANLDNVLVRNVTISNTQATSGSCLGFGRSNDAEHNEYIVMYDITITQCGPTFDPLVTNDINGVTAGDGARYWWLVDSDIGFCGADSIRTGTNVGGGHAANRGSDIYIGRNNFHDNGENAIDVKNSVRVIISQNEMHDIEDGADAGAEIVTVHEQAVDTAMIFNEFYEGRYGINTTGSGGAVNGVYIIGNVFHDVHHYAADTGYSETDISQSYGNAVNLGHGAGTDCYVVNNTFDLNDRHMAVEANMSNGCVIVGNIFDAPVGNSWGIGFENGSVHTASTITNNLFDTGGTWRRAQVTSTGYTTLAAYTAAHATKCSACEEAEPALQVDYTILETSPAVDSSVESAAYDAFEGAFGYPILFDRAGIARPQNAVWDMGAYEFDATGEPPPPPSADRTHRQLWRRRN